MSLLQLKLSNRTVAVEVASGQCIDTLGWANGYSDCQEELGHSKPNWCTDRGWTCGGYAQKGFCQNSKLTSAHYGGPALNFPENNCCVCGKQSVPEPGLHGGSIVGVYPCTIVECPHNENAHTTTLHERVSDLCASFDAACTKREYRHEGYIIEETIDFWYDLGRTRGTISWGVLRTTLGEAGLHGRYHSSYAPESGEYDLDQHEGPNGGGDGPNRFSGAWVADDGSGTFQLMMMVHSRPKGCYEGAVVRRRRIDHMCSCRRRNGPSSTNRYACNGWQLQFDYVRFA